MKSEKEIRALYEASRFLLDNYEMPNKLIEQHLCAITGLMAWIMDFKGTHETNEDVKYISTAMEHIFIAAKQGVEWQKKLKK